MNTTPVRLHDIDVKGLRRGPRRGFSVRFFRSLLRALTYARKQGDRTDFSEGSKLNRVHASLMGRLWRGMRRLIRPEVRERVNLWLLRRCGLAPIRRSSWKISRKKSQAKELGLKIIGPLSAECGLGEAARGSARAALNSGINTALFDFRDPFVARMSEELPSALSAEAEHQVTLFHVNPPEMLAHPLSIFDYCARDDYTIGYWLWETTDFPNLWLDAFGYIHEIWVSSSFCQEAISRKSPVPVVRIPLCVEPVSAAPLSREDLGLPSQGFIFLAMADFHSSAERKNPLGCLEAFCAAFGSTTEAVYLVLKLSNTEHRPEIRELLQQRAAEDSRIILIAGYIDRPRLNALIGHCDCLVSLHRSEGFGLPIAEAMSMGKVAIATGWSGNMDFMTHENSLPINYTLIPVNEKKGPYSLSEGVWAAPDLHHAALQMRRLVADRDLAAQLGTAAQQTISTNFSSEAIGKLIANRLAIIHHYLPR